jgi:Mg-chelatase subunit ChlD
MTVKRFYMFTAFLFVFLLSVVFAADKAPAEKKELPNTNAAAQSQHKQDGFDIIILMDSSGSMKKTDPQNYRKPAARLFISLLGEDDRIGIISFGDSANVLAALTDNTKKNREKLFDAVNRISSKEFSTNITEAVKKGFDELMSSQRKNRMLILMSDGKLALGSEEKDRAALAELSKLLPELARSGIKLYSIAFTEMSDLKLLEDMAKETGGFFRLAKSDKDIHLIFASIFEKIKSPDTVPLEGDTFNIDKDINEAILIITKQARTTTALIDPSKKKHVPNKHGKNMQWYESEVFDMITIKEPQAGDWKVKLSTREGNRVFVITNLSLKSSFDKGFVYKGDRIKIDAWLEREGEILKEKDVLEQIVFSAEAVKPNGEITKIELMESGTGGDSAAGDGKYSGELVVDNLGEYTIKIAAESKTFKREKLLQFKATEQPAQKAEQKTAPKSAAKADASWKAVLIKFGLINLSLLIAAGIIYLARKIAIKKKTKIKKGRK